MKFKVKIGAVIAVLTAVGGVALGVYAFMANASPYVSAKEAAAQPGVPVHVAGTIVRESVRNDVLARVLKFNLRDDAGNLLPVVYQGPTPGNFDSAPKASVSGSFRAGVFNADGIMTQCPSKYESEKGP